MGRPVKNYGVWKATPIECDAPGAEEGVRKPHMTIKFDDGSGRYEAKVNIKSSSGDSRLVYWTDRNFQHPILSSLQQIDEGFHPIDAEDSPSSSLGVDFQRMQPPLLQFSDGLLLPYDVPGPKNDILDELEPTMERAIASRANKIYIFGSSYGSGIHDVHMNQGSLPRFENGVYMDGCLVFHFVSEGGDDNNNDHFEAVFLAFASQKVPTNDRGLADRDSQELADIAKSVGDE